MLVDKKVCIHFSSFLCIHEKIKTPPNIELVLLVSCEYFTTFTHHNHPFHLFFQPPRRQNILNERKIDKCSLSFVYPLYPVCLKSSFNLKFLFGMWITTILKCKEMFFHFLIFQKMLRRNYFFIHRKSIKNASFERKNGKKWNLNIERRSWMVLTMVDGHYEEWNEWFLRQFT